MRLLFILPLIASLSACSLKPDLQMPPAPVPEHFPVQYQAAASVPRPARLAGALCSAIRGCNA
jgi:predicted small lipoprotein YifL